MGYWYPPPPSVFNPVPRPLYWHPENDGPYPEPADERFYGLGRGTDPVGPVWDPTLDVRTGNPIGWVAQPGCPENIGYDQNAPGPWKNYGDIVCVGGYGSGFNYYDRSPAQRLAYYRKMIALRAPLISWAPYSGDPEGGGLVADFADDHAMYINYFDCSDRDTPRRKVVIYFADGKTPPSTRQLNPDTLEWEDEGFDWDRDLPSIFQFALTAIGTVGAVALSFFSVSPAILAAWGGALAQMAAAAKPGGKIDPFMYIANWAKATQSIPDFTKVMSSVILKNDLVASLYTDARELATEAQVEQQEVLSFFASFTQAVNKNIVNVPKLDLPTATALLGGVVPDALAKVTSPNAILKAVSAYAAQEEQVFLSHRAHCPIMGPLVGDVLAWRQGFDATYASVLATDVSGVYAGAEPAYFEAEQAILKPAVDPFHGKDPRAPLNAIVAELKARYGLP